MIGLDDFLTCLSATGAALIGGLLGATYYGWWGAALGLILGPVAYLVPC